jgi:D-alanyl-D-alanine-carboxypeptidase/D-alanyl-D-alanine-endopeptidase
MRLVLVSLVVACSAPSRPVPVHKPVETTDPTGAHQAVVTGLVQPMVDAEIVSGVVVGLYDAGKLEIYGFGKGPDGKPPTGTTLFEIGSITKIYTSLLLADAIQRREVSLETHVADLLPPGVTMPTMENRPITLGQLALHTSGLPPLPPTIAAQPVTGDPYAHYNEEALYHDLVQTPLLDPPGTRVRYSNYGLGLLGFALGRKIGPGYATALQARVLAPLGLLNTFLAVPTTAEGRRLTGTNIDLAPVPHWTYDVLAGSGALVSDVHDQLALIDAELDAASGSRQTLRPAMRLTQEPQLEQHDTPDEGLGWQIDSAGRLWLNGSTGGFHSFIGFDPKTRRGVVVLASTAISLVDHLANDLYKILDNEPVTPPKFPKVEDVAAVAGTYELGDFKLDIAIKDKRISITGKGEPPYRLIPITDHEMWFEAKQSVVVFEKDGDKIARAVFVIGNQKLAAQRVN